MQLSQDQFDVLRLYRSEGVGPVTYYKLLSHYGSASDVIAQFESIKAKSMVLASKELIQTEIDNLAKTNGVFVFTNDELYPTLLKEITDPPPVLTVLGDPTYLNAPGVAIVGNRNASATAMNFTQKISRELGQEGFSSISGLARGIDTAAHRGSLQANAATIAVVAGGVDHIYPPENAKLRQQIIEHGCVISEMPIGMAPTAGHFPRRNRIISGMCKAVCVMECVEKSGSLITARYALEQNREVFAVPGNPTEPRSVGPNSLIRQGAHMLETISDILKVITSFNTVQESLFDAKIVREKPVNSQDEPSRVDTILSLLSTTPIDTDDLIRKSGLTYSHAIMAITELEIYNKIKKLPGNQLILNKF